MRRAQHLDKWVGTRGKRDYLHWLVSVIVTRLTVMGIDIVLQLIRYGMQPADCDLRFEDF